VTSAVGVLASARVEVEAGGPGEVGIPQWLAIRRCSTQDGDTITDAGQPAAALGFRPSAEWSSAALPVRSLQFSTPFRTRSRRLRLTTRPYLRPGPSLASGFGFRAVPRAPFHEWRNVPGASEARSFALSLITDPRPLVRLQGGQRDGEAVVSTARQAPRRLSRPNREEQYIAASVICAWSSSERARSLRGARGAQTELRYLGETRVMLYELPLSEIVSDSTTG